MNDLLQKHGCSNVFAVPEGLKELMSDITREVLREQPKELHKFIANYLSALLITREHGVMAVSILEELCDCKPSVSEHLMELGLDKEAASVLSSVIKDEIESLKVTKNKEIIKETDILKKILNHVSLDEEMTVKICQIVRNAYKDYVYRRKLFEQATKVTAQEPWEVAAERTLALYKNTKPTLDELNRATERIQAAYKGYHVRRNLLKHLKPKMGPKESLPGPPVDISCSREIDLGPVLDIKVREDDMNAIFGRRLTGKLGLRYDPVMTLTHVQNDKDISPFPVHANLEGVKCSTDDHYSTNPEICTVHVEHRRRDNKNAFHSSNTRHQFDQETIKDITVDEDFAAEHRTVGTPARKISFSMVPPEMIPNEYPDTDMQVQEAILEVLDEAAVDCNQEIPEDILGNCDAVGSEEEYTPVDSVVSVISSEIEEQVDFNHREA